MAATTNEKQAFGRRLKELRERAGVSRMFLAYSCDRTEQMVYAWERGRSLPSPEILDAIANALGCSRDDLLSEDGARAS